MKKSYENNNNGIFHHCALKRGLGKIENMKLSNILYAFSTFSAFTLTSGNSPDKKKGVPRVNNRLQLPSHNLTEINFLGQLEDNQFKGLSHLDSITSTYLTNANSFSLQSK